MNISHTVYPDQVLDQNEWMKTFRVATLVDRHQEGRTRAINMMDEWRKGKDDFSFKAVADGMKILFFG